MKLFLALLAILAYGCGATTMVNGIQVYESQWRAALHDLQPRS